MDTRKDTANRGSRSRTQPRPGHEQADEARLLILAAQREGNRLLVSALRPLGLTPAQAEVICVLAEYEPLTVVALGNYLICESGSPSRLVDNCVRHGWVMRAGGEDRRTVQLRLAPAGQALVPDIQQVYNGIGSMIADVVGERRLRALTDSLRLMLQGTESGAKVTQRFDASDRADAILRDSALRRSMAGNFPVACWPSNHGPNADHRSGPSRTGDLVPLRLQATGDGPLCAVTAWCQLVPWPPPPGQPARPRRRTA